MIGLLAADSWQMTRKSKALLRGVCSDRNPDTES